MKRYTGERELLLEDDDLPDHVLEPSLLSEFCFWPVNDKIRTAARRQLNSNDMWPLNKIDQADTLATEFSQCWNDQLKKKRPSLGSVIIWMSMSHFVVASLLLLLVVFWSLVAPLLLPNFIEYLAYDSIEEEWWGWIYVGAIMGASIIIFVLSKHADIIIEKIALRTMSGLQFLIYDKMLRLSIGNINSGEVLNLMTSDTQQIGNIIPTLVVGCSNIIRLLTITYLLYTLVGLLCFLPAGFLLLVLPLAVVLGGNIFNNFDAIQTAKDVRVKLINELCNSIRIVKYYAWENAFKKKIETVRNTEIDKIYGMYIWCIAFYGLLETAPNFSIVITFVIYGLFYTPTLAVIFTTLNLLEQVHLIFVNLPTLITQSLQLFVCVGRIKTFLMKEELPMKIGISRNETSPYIEIRDGDFYWDTSDTTFSLKGINLRIEPGTLTMVCGRVGSGKSSLGYALISEMCKSQGTVNIVGDICYVAQTAWILNDTVKENILFGRPYNQKLYQKVLQYCALNPDLKIMPSGDLSEIGEHGINLSGGQKQRVAIARALYSEKDHYIFDDPLSAVDAHVGKHIFENAIIKFLGKKSVLLITNQLHFLPHSDNILYMENGQISAQGSFKEIIQNNQQFQKMMEEHGVFQQTKNEEKKEEGFGGEDTKSKQTDYKLIVEEETKQGKVSWDVYKFYIKCSGFRVYLSLIFIIIFQGSVVASTWWLQFWPTDMQSNPNARDSSFYIIIYAVLNIGSSVFLILFFWSLTFMTVVASTFLHQTCLDNTIRAPISFFDTTPIGRIISRFSTDMNAIDMQLMPIILDVVYSFVMGIAVIVAMSLGTPWILITTPFFGIIFYWIQNYFRKLSNQVKRLEAVTRAPVYSFFSETLAGVTTVRCWGDQKRFIKEIIKRINHYNCHWYSLKYAYTWYGLFSAHIANALQLVTYVVVVLTRIYFRDTSFYNTGLLAVTITMAPLIVESMKYFAKNITEIETEMNAVERVQQYVDMPQEADAIIPNNRPPHDWPSRGVIEFRDLKMRYRPNSPLVLNGITVTIKSHEKVGIVGRTGAGKSSLMQALFRLVEASEGRIVIDNIDISTLGLEDLRSRISIIPQEPIMFIGTVRYNLDPFDQYQESDIWESLKLSNLDNHVMSLPNKLDEDVVEGGSNFSVGQRQLICMARTLLQKPKILLMDEATASVDMETDRIIQKMIRTAFADTTLLVIAHRLNTVMDMDRILVIDKGNVVEFNTPKILANDNDSTLSGMIDATGPTSADHLRKVANGSS